VKCSVAFSSGVPFDINIYETRLGDVIGDLHNISGTSFIKVNLKMTLA